MNGLSSTLKWWAELLAFMSVVYARITQWSDFNPAGMYGLWAVCLWWLIRSCCNKQEVRCHTCLNLSCLHYGCQHCTLAVAHLRSAQECSILGKIKHAFWPQASTLQTHFRNAVPLVWGSLRLAPTIHRETSCACWWKYSRHNTPLCITSPMYSCHLKQLSHHWQCPTHRHKITYIPEGLCRAHSW